ncbi:MAG: transcription factor FapR [Ruminococcaceae bacterium]|nr:transcription factor FapR [Oscillospiraceae bacterium]
MAKQSLKKQRQQKLMEKLEENPFLTDEDLANIFCVSVPTIRFDRAQLGVKEYRERIKNVAIAASNQTSEWPANNPMGELLDLNLFKDGLSVFVPDESMTFDDSNVVRGCFIYSFAEMLATTVIDADVALVDVANIKYKQPVIAGSKLVAKSEVVRRRNNEYIVWVKIKANMTEVFRSKFILSVID